MSQSGLSNFNVSGGVFNGAQQMGWHVTNEKGFTVAVSPDASFCKRLADLETLVDVLKSVDAYYHLSERHDQGYLEADEQVWDRLKTVFRVLGVK